MDSTKRNNESEMGSGDSDDEFYNVKLPYTPDVASDKPVKKVEVKKVYSPPRTKVQYNYKFDSSSDEESEYKSHSKGAQSGENSKKEKKDKHHREKGNLSQNTYKVVEKINEELRTMKNSASKPQTDKTDNPTGQNHIATSVATSATVARPSLNVVPPVVVVPPPMVMPQTPVMGPMIVPSPLSPMAVMGNMIRSPNPIAISNSVMGMNAVPNMMGVQGNIVGMPGGMINPAAMMMRMPTAGNPMFRMQGISRPSSGLVGVPRPVSLPSMVSNPIIANPGGLMVMGGLMSNSVPGASQVQMVNSPQGNLSIRVPPPPPFLSLRGRPPVPPVPPASFRWQAKAKGSPTGSSPRASSPSSSPPDKSSRDYDGEELSREEGEKSPSVDTDESQSPPREMPNTFKNDGSFMEMFKKMTEESENNQEASSSSEKVSEASDSPSTLKRPSVMLSGIVGKRRGGRVLKTGLVKKVKKGGEVEEEKHPKDAWSMYMAEVKKYREASCEEEGKTRPLVK